MASNDTELKALYVEQDDDAVIEGRLTQTQDVDKEEGTENSANAPTAKNSKVCAYIILMTDVTLFVQLGFVITSLNPASPALMRFFNETYVARYSEPAPPSTLTLLLTLTLSMVLGGAVVGSLCTKIFGVYLSRKGAMLCYHLITIFSVLLMGVLTYYLMSYELLIIGRFISGFARGFGMTVVTVYVAELCCFESLQLFQSPPGWLMAFGCILGNILGHPKVLGGDATWPILISFTGVFSLVYLANFPFLIHTPIHWIKRNRKDKAVEALTKLRSSNVRAVEYEADKLEENLKKAGGGRVMTPTEVVKSKPHRTELILSILIMMNTQTCGFALVMLYSDSIFISAGIPAEQATFASIGVFGESVILAILGTFAMKKISMDKLLIFGNWVIIVATILLCISIAIQDLSSAMSIISVIAIIIYMFGVGVGPLLVSFSLVVAITSPRSRPSVMVISSTVFWFTSWLVGFTAPFLMDAIGAYTWLIYTAITLASTIYFMRSLKHVLAKMIDKNDEVSVKPLPEDLSHSVRISSI